MVAGWGRPPFFCARIACLGLTLPNVGRLVVFSSSDTSGGASRVRTVVEGMAEGRAGGLLGRDRLLAGARRAGGKIGALGGVLDGLSDVFPVAGERDASRVAREF